MIASHETERGSAVYESTLALIDSQDSVFLNEMKWREIFPIGINYPKWCSSACKRHGKWKSEEDAVSSKSTISPYTAYVTGYRYILFISLRYI